jgi:hypothetical protein
MTDLGKELTVKLLSANPTYVRVALSVIDHAEFIRASLIAEFAGEVEGALRSKFMPEDGWAITNTISAALRGGDYRKKDTGIYLRRTTWPPDCFVAITADFGATNLGYGVWGRGACEGDLGQKLHGVLSKGVGRGKSDTRYNPWWLFCRISMAFPVRSWSESPAIIAMQRRQEFVQHLVGMFVDVEKAVRPILDPA